MNFQIENESTKLLVLLLIADFGFILLNCAYYLVHGGMASNPLFSIQKDGGYAEVFQYIKEFWIFVLLLMLAVKKSQVNYLAWSVLFVYLLLDDSLQIHERFGSYLVGYFEFQPMFQLRAQDFGELAVSMFFGFFIFTFIGVSYWFSDNIAKKTSKHLLILVISMVFFGVVVDMAHIAIPWGKSIWGLIEDGGEMMVMSIIFWYVFHLRGNSNDHVSFKLPERA